MLKRVKNFLKILTDLKAIKRTSEYYYLMIQLMRQSYPYVTVSQPAVATQSIIRYKIN